MPQRIENYTPQLLVAKFRGQALRVWSIGLALVFLWAMAIVLAPAFAAGGHSGLSGPVYGFFSYLCHQEATRSFDLHGHPLAVCARCFGVYFGILLGFAIYPLFRNIAEIEPLSRLWLFLAMIPIGIDWSLGAFGFWENTHLSRFLTGLVLGVACAVFIVPALVEISRNFSRAGHK
jgi:uncharacterized membrane protein